MEPILYKKKITTIVNEYYKVSENNTGEFYKVSPVVYNNETLNSYPPGNPAEFDRAAFTDSVMSYFESYSKKVQDLINASAGTEEELNLAEENAFKDLWSLGVLLRPFYTAEFSERLTHQLRSFILLEMQVISFIRQGYDTKTWTDRITNFPVNDLSQLLGTYNGFYNRDNVRLTWSNVTDAWLDAIKAKIAKDSTKFNESIGRAKENLMSFASYLAQGVIQQHSSRFFEPAPTV